MKFKKLITMFENGNVSVYGLRGRGKDMLFANVIARRRRPYVSNTTYVPFLHTELDFNKLDCHNTYDNFIKGNINKYEYPYDMGADIYISDCGVILPSQYCNELNRKYPYIPVFMALSRQLGKCNVHTNTQALNRTWDKLREQSDKYICCKACFVLFGLVFQKVIIYEKYESAEKNVPPLKIKVPFNKHDRVLVEQEKRSYLIQYGNIKTGWLVYKNKSKFNTTHFKQLLENGYEDSGGELYERKL